MKKKKLKKLLIRILFKVFIILGLISSTFCLFKHAEQINQKKSIETNTDVVIENNIEESNTIQENVIDNSIIIEEKQNETPIIQEEKKVEEVKKEEPVKTTSKTTTAVTSRGTTSVERKETTKITENNGEWIAFNASAYCPCAKCCGKTNGITASGTKATAGRTVAMPKGYAFGTKIEIKGMGTYIVEDRGGAIKGNKIDIYFNTHQEALNFGRKTVYLKVVK